MKSFLLVIAVLTGTSAAHARVFMCLNEEQNFAVTIDTDTKEVNAEDGSDTIPVNVTLYKQYRCYGCFEVKGVIDDGTGAAALTLSTESSGTNINGTLTLESLLSSKATAELPVVCSYL